MAGYGIRAYLIAQSLNQISKAYGENNAILDNCHVRIAFSSNDERTAKRISRRARHGDRTARAAQLCRPPARALAQPRHGQPPGDGAAAADAGRGHAAPAGRRAGARLRACRRSARKKLRYYEDRNFIHARAARARAGRRTAIATGRAPRPDDWSGQVRGTDMPPRRGRRSRDRPAGEDDEGGLQQQRHPGLPEAEVVKPTHRAADHRARPARRRLRRSGRQAPASSRAPSVGAIRRPTA